MAVGGFPTSRPVVPLVLVALLAAASVAAAVRAPLASTDAAPNLDQPIGKLIGQGMSDPRFAARVQHFLQDHSVGHPQKLDLQGKSPLEVARQTLTTEERAGRTPVEWVQLAKAQNLLALRPEAKAEAKGDLVADITRLDADAGMPLTSAQRAQLQRDADALQPDVRAALGDLVHALVLAWEAQAPIAAREVQAAQHVKLPTDLVLSDADREASLQHALALLAAENAFRDAAARIAWPPAPVGATTPLFRDPLGLVILGSTGNDAFHRDSVFRDPILIVAPPHGSDTFDVTAAGACPDPLHVVFDCNGLVISTILDLGGTDTFSYSGTPTPVQGSGALGGIGLLVDAAGSARFQSDFVRSRGNVGGYYLDAGAQGNGFGGVGLLVAGPGSHTFVQTITDSQSDAGIWDMSQGFGNVGGIGILADAGSDEHFLNYGFDGNCGGCFQGMYNGGTGFYGGTGILTSTGLGKAEYHGWDNATSTDMYAWGFGAFGGTGIFYDAGGINDFAASQDSTNNVVEVPLLNCAFGTASYAGLGVFIDMGSKSSYFSDTASSGPYGGSVFTQSEGFGGPAEGEGLFVHVNGDDGHFMQAHPNHGPNAPEYTTGRGVTLHGGEGLTGNTFGVFLDVGGDHTYTGAPPSRPNAWWGMGADIKTTGSLPAIDPLGGL